MEIAIFLQFDFARMLCDIDNKNAHFCCKYFFYKKKL